jgi:hypothetical protein
MNQQSSLTFEIAEPEIKSLVDMVKVLMSGHDWICPYELCEEIWRTRGIRVSDSTITARIRDLRKCEYGSHTISIRRRSGTRAYEYKLEIS